jgi:hypothetical protein
MELLKEWWAFLTAVAGLGVWLVRLEGNSKTALREIDRLDRQIEKDRMITLEARREQNEMLREMRADIRRLLERKQT